ncbi:hypothetical protein AB4Y45_35030 [Paraburkholderia sp. EG287A]|uniref:hypothetical protein n=1 Tax=Paraburkholderia sp. EG287A TaxID=3237012 RepID=UPI0034D366BA
MKSLRTLAVLALAAAASTAAFANGGGARGGVYPASAPVAATATSKGDVAKAGFGGTVSTTSDAGSKGSLRLNADQVKLFAHH